MLTDVAAREAYHLLLLEFLLQRLGPRLILKGGVNLRLFFGSPRYSQDIDFDAEPQARDAVRAAIRGALADSQLRRRCAEMGVGTVEAPERPQKDSETTLRFKFLLVSSAGVPRNTKVEVSFRPRPPLDTPAEEAAPPALVDRYRSEPARPRIARRRGRGTSAGHGAEAAPEAEAVEAQAAESPAVMPLVVPHYRRLPALRQKIGALALRSEVQARDVFDLGVLADGSAGAIGEADAAELRQALPDSILRKAAARALEIPYDEYRDKVLYFLDAPDRARVEAPEAWEERCLRAAELAEHLLALPGPAWVPWYPDEPRPEGRPAAGTDVLAGA